MSFHIIWKNKEEICLLYLVPIFLLYYIFIFQSNFYELLELLK